MPGYTPWDKSWDHQIIYLPWIQPDLPGMENSPVLPAYPLFFESLKNGFKGNDFFTAVASAMVFLLGHEPGAEINPLYCAWLRGYNDELAVQLFYHGTEMTASFNFPQAVWMLQASLLLEPEVYETNYNLGLAFNHLAAKLAREEKDAEAADCYHQARQYFTNAAQLKHAPRGGGEVKSDEGYDSGLHGQWQG